MGLVAEKLTRTNYVLWRAQVTPQLRGAGYFGYVDGTMPEPAQFIVKKDKDGKEETTPNPLYPIWFREGQQVLGYLLNNLTKEVLVQVTSIATPHELWAALAHMFSSQSRARVNNIRVALSTAQKGTQSVAAYFAHMRSLADELAAAGKPIDDDELISYITSGLDMEYQPLISANDARTEPISIDDLYAQMSNFDQRLALYSTAGSGGGFKSSANAASRGRGGGGRRSGGSSRYRGSQRSKGKSSGGDGNPSPRSSNGGGGRPYNNSNKGRRGGRPRATPDIPRCQICGKPGHTARDCWYRYEEDGESSQDEKVAGAAEGSYGVDTNWYVDSGATDHITGELEKVTMREKYRGQDQVHTANGEGHEENSLSR